MKSSNPSRLLAGLSLAVAAAAAQAADIAYISSSSGYLLHNSGGTATTADWRGQGAIRGFSGYGAVSLDGQCLTGRSANQPLRWEACKGGDKAQVWALRGGKLNNELGYCADVEGNRGGAGVRVLAWNCTGAPNQHWKAHALVSGPEMAGRIPDLAARAAFLASLKAAAPGTVISLASGKVVASGGANAVAAGGANAVASGGGNVIAPGGAN